MGGVERVLRSIKSLDTCYTILKSVAPQTGHIIINDLHLSACKPRVLKQVYLVFGTVLQWRNKHMDTSCLSNLKEKLTK